MTRNLLRQCGEKLTDIIPQKWYAFFAPLPNGSETQHRIIIITDEPEIKYLYITSQVEKARIRCKKDISSLVELSPADWKHLKKECCILCGKAYLQSITKEDFKKLNVRHLGEIPEGMKSKIKYAICYSKTYTDSEKKNYTIA